MSFFVSMVLALTMAPETMAFQLRPQHKTRMKGTSQHFQNDRDVLPKRVTAVECNLSSMKETLERIEKRFDTLDTKLETKFDKLDTKIETKFDKLETKIDKLVANTSVIAFVVFTLCILSGMVNLPQLVGLFKGI
jgi:predicted nuclease with TOPRIM domain